MVPKHSSYLWAVGRKSILGHTTAWCSALRSGAAVLVHCYMSHSGKAAGAMRLPRRSLCTGLPLMWRLTARRNKTRNAAIRKDSAHCAPFSTMQPKKGLNVVRDRREGGKRGR